MAEKMTKTMIQTLPVREIEARNEHILELHRLIDDQEIRLQQYPIQIRTDTDERGIVKPRSFRVVYNGQPGPLKVVERYYPLSETECKCFVDGDEQYILTILGNKYVARKA